MAPSYDLTGTRPEPEGLDEEAIPEAFDVQRSLARAQVLGAIQVGSNTRIGAGSVVVRNVEADCTVVGIPGRVIHQSGVRINPLAHSALPDAEANVIRNLMERIDQLEGQVRSLQDNLRSMATASGRPLREVRTGKAQNLKAPVERQGQHGDDVGVHEGLAAGEPDFPRAQVQIPNLVQLRLYVAEREIFKPVVRRARFDIAVGALDIAERASIEPERLQPPKRHLGPPGAVGGDIGIAKLGGVEAVGDGRGRQGVGHRRGKTSSARRNTDGVLASPCINAK